MLGSSNWLGLRICLSPVLRRQLDATRPRLKVLVSLQMGRWSVQIKQVWWFGPVSLTWGDLKQKDEYSRPCGDFEANVGHVTGPCLKKLKLNQIKTSIKTKPNRL